MQRKTFELIETKTDGEAGAFSAYASIFSNVDRVGDRMLRGSFSRTLGNWRKKGKPLPVILSHEWSDPHKYVGEADPAAVYEDERGLVVQGRMYTDEPLGKKVYELMKRGILTGWSFGYKVPPGGQRQRNGVNEISEVELFEVGPCLVGMNEEAQLQEIKSVLAEETDLDPDALRTHSLALAVETLKELRASEVDAGVPAELVGTDLDPLTNLDAPVEQLMKQWPAAVAARKQAVHEEAVYQGQRRAALSRPPTRIDFDPKRNRWVEIDARHPDDISPGYNRNGARLPSKNERRAAAEEANLRKQEEEAKEAELRAEGARHEAARKAYEEEVISVGGVRMRRRDVRVR